MTGSEYTVIDSEQTGSFVSSSAYPTPAAYSSGNGSKSLYAFLFICIGLILLTVMLPAINGLGSLNVSAPRRGAHSKKEEKEGQDSITSGSSKNGQRVDGIKKRSDGKRGFEVNPYAPANTNDDEPAFNGGYVYKPAGEVQVDDEDTGYTDTGLRSKVSTYIKTIPKNSYIQSVSSATTKTANAAASVVPSISFSSNYTGKNLVKKRTAMISPGANQNLDATKAYNTNIDNEFDYDKFIEDQEKEDLRDEDDDLMEKEEEERKLKKVGQSQLEDAV